MPVGTLSPAAQLAARRDELRRAIARRDVIAVERHADPMDSVFQLIDREAGAATLQKLSDELVAVEAAIEQLRAGGYGTCLDCEHTIPALRLQAVPWATRCVRCQQRADAEAAAPCGGLLEER